MSELLLELFSEEIPAMMQRNAASKFKEIFSNYFTRNHIIYNKIETFVSTRRICIYANGISRSIEPICKEIKGPKITAPNQAIEGFCKSNNITRDLLEIKKIKNIEFYIFNHKTISKQTSEFLKDSLSQVISEYVWPKSMYWGDYKIKWVRPLRNILCIYDKKIIPFQYGHLIANNITRGHRFMSDKIFKIEDFREYQTILQNNFVILDQLEKENLIKKALDEEAEKLNLIIKEDPILLEEVTGLVEYPRILKGKINEKFLSVPSEILISAMRSHQKYFSVFNKDGNFAPYFFFVSNILSTDEKSVIEGNEKVLSARLADALYFYNQDLKSSLSDKANKLENVIFHAKIGSLKHKTDRLHQLVKFIAPDNKASHQASLLCKSDIVSEVVDEFPNLQGIMGYYYALAEGQNESIALAIRDHYKPSGPSDKCPTDSAAILALADKIDNLCGLILAGEKPSGSKDPFALRRQALGIIRIIIDNKINLNLNHLVIFTLGLYKNEISINDEAKEQIILFLSERIRYFLKSDYTSQLISASFQQKSTLNLIDSINKLNILQKFLDTEEGQILVLSYKRASNILTDQNISGTININKFISHHETDLYNCINDHKNIIEISYNKQDYQQTFSILASFHKPLDSFFDNILVKDSDPEIAHNRLLILLEIKNIFNKIADFDKL